MLYHHIHDGKLRVLQQNTTRYMVASCEKAMIIPSHSWCKLKADKTKAGYYARIVMVNIIEK